MKFSQIIRLAFTAVLCVLAAQGAELKLAAVPSGTAGRITVLRVDAGTKLTIFDGVAPVGTATADRDGFAAIGTQGLAPGQHSLRAVEWGSGRVLAGPTSVLIAGTVSRGLQAPSYSATGSIQTAFACGDLDGDGLPDFVFAGRDGITLLLSRTPGLMSTLKVSEASLTVAIAIVDLNGDGLNDVVMAQSDGKVAVFMNRGSGVFADPVHFRGAAQISTLVVADFNSDGIPDLAVTDPANGDVAFLFGRGDGTLEVGPIAHVGRSPGAMAVADFNNDGLADLAVADLADGSVSLLTGSSSGVFDVKQFLPARQGPVSLAVGDFNEDGYADLIVVSHTEQKAFLLLNSGHGGFRSPVVVGTGLDALTMDFDGDGHLDVVLRDSASASVELGRGDGTFSEGVSVKLPAPSIQLAGGDFNGDGISDLASLDSSGVLAVIRGTAGYAVAGGGVEDPALRTEAVRGPKAMLGSTPLTISLSSSSNPAVFGQSLTLTANASANGAAGYVTFYDGTTVLGTSSLGSGQAVMATEFVAPGNRSLKAAYGGDLTYTPATSAVLVQSIVTLPQKGFGGKTDFSTGLVPFAVAVGDFNGDGKMDLAVANSGANNVEILLGDGTGGFFTQTSKPSAFATDMSPYAVAVGDFNRDGKSDLAVANRTTNDVSILLGNGDGTFLAAANVGVGTNPQGVAVGDFNGDGIADLVVANAGSNNVTVLLGNGDGTFQTGTPFGAGTSPFSVAVSDFNGDGKADLAVANNSSSNVSILLGNGDGTFQTAVNYGAGTQPSSVAVADLGNGKVDLVVADLTYSASAPAGNVSVLIGNGDGTFKPRTAYSSGVTPSSANPRSVAVGDFNGDGIPDIAVANRGGNNLSFMLGNGDGTFQPATTLATNTTPQSIVVGDFNGDGRPDLAVVTSANNKVSVLLGTPAYPDLTVSGTHSGNFTQGQTGAVYTLTVSNTAAIASSGIVSLTDTLPASLTATSISGTGWACTLATLTCTRGDSLASGGSYPVVNVVVNIGVNAPVNVTNSAVVSGGGEAAGSSNSGSDPTIIIQVTSISLSSSANPATLGQSVTISATVTPGSATGRVIFYAGQNPLGDAAVVNGVATLVTSLLPVGNLSLTAIYTGDATDLPSTTISTLSQTVQSVLQDGFQAVLNYPVGNTGPVALAYGDFNGDGIPDLAVVNSTASSKVSILLGSASGIFGSPVSYATGGLNSAPLSVAVADVNGDGKPDLIVANSNTNNVSVLLGNGDINGTFQSAVNYSAGTDPQYVVAGDFNRDGIVDIAVADWTTGKVSVLLGTGGTGASAFQSAVSYAAGTNPAALALGDFNGDGKTDIAVANNGSGNVTILAGNGDGTFTSIGSYAAGTNPSSIVSADFNGDGNLDLAVVNAGSGNISILLGAGGGNFNGPVNYLAGTSPTAIAVGDMNGDGIPDLVISNSGSNNVSVLTGVGDGTFQLSGNYNTDGGPAGVLVADFNRDGFSDIAVANQATNDVSILFGGMFYSDMTIAKSHTGNFSQGQVGVTYTLSVSNVGQYQSSGAVIVTDLKPASLSITSMAGTGWTCTVSTAKCTRTDSLAVGASYPSITVTANVGTGAPTLVTNTATVAGGGEINTANDSATDNAIVMQTSTVTFTASPSLLTYNESTTLTAAISPSAATGTVTFSDGGTVLGVVTVVNGSASLPPAPLSVGQHTLTAVYSGDITYNGSNATLSENVARAAAQVTLSNLSFVYDGTAKSATVTTNPTGLAVSVTYSGNTSAPTAPGSYVVNAAVTDPNYAGSATGVLVISKIAGTVTLSSLAAVYDGTSKPVTATTSPSGLTVSVTYNGSSSVPVNAGTYAIVATISDPFYSGSATGSLVVSQASGSVVLGGLSATYNGSPQSITAVTTPANLSVGYTYNGIPQAPTNAGTYSVVASINDTNYSGTATGTFVISKATAGVTVPNVNVTWDGGPKSVTAVTVPAGVSVAVAYNGVSTAPSAVGTYTVLATVNDPNYTGSGTGTLTISAAPATVTLSNLAGVYSGSPVTVGVTTSPANLNVSVTYAGSSNAPVNVGSYPVVASVTTPGYSGTSSATLVISKGTATIALSSLTSVYDGTPKTPVATPNPTGLQVNISFTGLTSPPSNAGSYPFVATVNDPNYMGTTSGTMTISPAAATVQLGSLAAVYDGTPKPATAVTAPTGLGVTFTYNGSSSVPVAVGSYSVVGTVSSPNYTGSAAGTLVIARGSATVNVAGSTVVYDGTPKSASITTVPANLNVTVTYNGSTNAPTTAGSYAIVATVVDPNYSGSGTGTLIIQKATPTLVWVQPANIVFGSTLGSSQLNATANVKGSFVYAPGASTLLPVGNGQLLSATFLPTDTVDYNSAAISTTINVIPNTASSGVQIIGSVVLSRNANNDIVAAVTLADTGGTAAQDVILTTFTISSVAGTPLPQSMGTIQAQSFAGGTVVVPGSAVKSGAVAVIGISGTFAGGKFSTGTKMTAP